MWWFADERHSADVVHVLTRINRGRRICVSGIARAGDYWDALKRVAAINGNSDDPENRCGAENPFARCLRTLAVDAGSRLLANESVKALQQFAPAIRDPGDPRTAATAKSEGTSSNHRDAQRTELSRLADAMNSAWFIFRNSKSPRASSGPSNAALNEEALSVFLAAQETLLDELLDRPSQRLVAYGSIRPRESNAWVLDFPRQEWLDCTIHGSITERKGYRYYQWIPGGSSYAAQCLISEELPKHWARIDAFEGPEYWRALIPTRTSRGLTMANVYCDASLSGA